MTKLQEIVVALLLIVAFFGIAGALDYQDTIERYNQPFHKMETK